MTHWPLTAALCVCSLLAGVLAMTLSGVDWRQPVTPGDILDPLITLLVAALLGALFQRQFSEARVEKDILLAQARETGLAMRAAREVFLKAYFDTSSDQLDREVIASLRNTSSHLSALEAAVKLCKVRPSSSSLVEARSALRSCRKVLTERVLIDGMSYSQEEYTQAEPTFSEFNRALLAFAIDLNRA